MLSPTYTIPIDRCLLLAGDNGGLPGRFLGGAVGSSWLAVSGVNVKPKLDVAMLIEERPGSGPCVVAGVIYLKKA